MSSFLRAFAATLTFVLSASALAGEAAKMTPFTSKGAGVTFNVPAGWEKSGDGSQHLGDLVGFIRMGEAMLKLTADPPAGGATLKQAVADLFAPVEAMSEKFKLLQKEEAKAGGVPAILYHFSSTQQGHASMNWMLYFRKDAKANILSLTMSGSAERAAANEAIFKQAVASLKFQ